MKQPGAFRFLVIDDHADGSRVAAWLLQTAFADAEVVEAATIEQFTDTLTTQRIDCVLLDSAASTFNTVLPTLWMQCQVDRVPVVLLAGERHLVQHRLAAEQGIGYLLIKEDVSPLLVQHVVLTAIEVSALRLMLDEQGRELERLHGEVEAASASAIAGSSSSPATVSTLNSVPTPLPAPASPMAIVDVRPLETDQSRMPVERAEPGKPRLIPPALIPPALITASATAPSGEEDELARRMQEKLLPPGSPFIEGF